MQATVKNCHQGLLLRCGLCNNDSPDKTSLLQQEWQVCYGVTNSSLTELHVCSIGGTHGGYWKPIQKPLAEKIIGHRLEATATVILSGQDMPVKLPSK